MFYLSRFLDTYAWCLLPNHFHLIVQVKSTEEIKATLQRTNPKEITLTENRFLYGKNVIVAESWNKHLRDSFNAMRFPSIKSTKGREIFFISPLNVLK